jgi:acyl-CoA synthetase (NDP forming)
VLTVVGGRSAAGQRAAAWHTAAAATSLATQEALFSQAGVIVTTSLGELVDAAALLACQPLPTGNRVAIVSNAGGAAVLAADACGDNGLQVAAVSAPVQRRLRALLPAGAAVQGPVHTTAAISDETFRACLEAVAADDGADALIAVAVPTAISDLRAAVTTAAVGKPMAVVLAGQAESVRLLASGDAGGSGGPGTAAGVPAGRGAGGGVLADGDAGGSGGPGTAAGVPAGRGAFSGSPVGRGLAVAGLPAYAYPEGAARALGHAARYRAWRDRDPGKVPGLPGVRTAGARELVGGFLARQSAGGWLPPAAAADLLACYEIPLGPAVRPDGERDAGKPGAGASCAVELLIGVKQEPVFGPVVVLGLGGPAAGVLGDRAARLTPLTDTDAYELIRHSPAAPLLCGPPGATPAGTGALAGILLRVSRLADDLPEVAELDLNPVIVGPGGASAAAAQIRLSPAEPRDPFLRRLR